jgi:hypothetical protein
MLKYRDFTMKIFLNHWVQKVPNHWLPKMFYHREGPTRQAIFGLGDKYHQMELSDVVEKF